MTALVELLNRGLTPLVDLLLGPLAALGAFWSLTLLAVAAGGLLSVALRLVLGRRGVGKAGRGGLARRALGVLLLGLLLALAVAQLPARYDARPLRAGEAALVTATVRDPALLGDPSAVRLEAGRGAVVETPAVRIPRRGEAVWRVRVREEGERELAVVVGSRRYRKAIVAGSPGRALSRIRAGDEPLVFLRNPGEEPLPPDAAVRSIEVRYPPWRIGILGRRVRWPLLFLVVAGAAFLLVGRITRPRS